MFGYQRHHLVPLALATSLGLMALGASTAQAHTHPSPIERAAPAVVFIEARAHVEVTLIEHDKLPDKHDSHVHVFQYTADPVLDTASGFFVEPNGTIVTTGALLRQSRAPGEVWAVNQAFASRYPKQVTWPANLSTPQHIGVSTDRLEQRLQACYRPQQGLPDAGGCVIRSRIDFIVHPYVTSQTKDGNLRAEALYDKSTKDVGLLRVQTNGVPTVTLGRALPTDYAMDVLGFVGIPGAVSTVPDPKNTNPHGQHDIVQHFDPKGGPLLKYKGLEPAEAAGSAMLKQQLGKGIEGGPVVAAGKDATSGGQVIGLIPGPAPAGQPVPTLIGATTILNVLKSAGVENRFSLTSSQFETAMHYYKNKKYAASIPYLENTLKQFRGHALAAASLSIARDQVKKGAGSPPSTMATTTSGGPGSAGSSRVQPLLIALVAAALATLLAVGIALRQRRREGDGDKDVRPLPASAVPARAPGTGSLKPGPGPARGASAPSGDPAGGPGAAPRTAGAAGAAVSRVRERPDLLRQTSSTTPSPATQPSRHRPTPDRGSSNQPSALQRSANNNPSTAHQLTAGAASAATAPAPDATKFCTSCGGQLAAGHRFCGRCGASAGI